MSEFVCITFGPTLADPNFYWNDRERFSTQRSAERYGLDKLSIAGTFGYVVIEEGEDFWEVVDQIGPAVSIGAQKYTYTVQPAPSLQIL